MQKFLYSMVSGSGNLLFHCILLFWVFTAFILSFNIAKRSKNKNKLSIVALFLMVLLHVSFCISLVYFPNPSAKLPPSEYAILAIDTLLFVIVWLDILDEKKNVWKLIVAIFVLMVLSIESNIVWSLSKAPFFSDLNASKGNLIQQVWVSILFVIMIYTSLISFRKKMPFYFIMFASVILAGLVLHTVLNDWIFQTNYSPFLRISMLISFPIVMSSPLVQLATHHKNRTTKQAEENKNKFYDPGIELKDNSFVEQNYLTKTQPFRLRNATIFSENSTFSLIDFLDIFVEEKNKEYEKKNVKINSFYQGNDFNLIYDQSEFKATFESFFSFLEIICDRDFIVNIALGIVSEIEIIQIDIEASPDKIAELADQLMIAGQRFEELGIKNDYALESSSILRMQLAL